MTIPVAWMVGSREPELLLGKAVFERVKELTELIPTVCTLPPEVSTAVLALFPEQEGLDLSLRGTPN